MERRKYIIRLSQEERSWLLNIVKNKKAAAYKRVRAQIVLRSDIGESGPSWNDDRIAKYYGVTTRTIETQRKRVVTEGLEKSVERKKADRTMTKKIDGEGEAELIKLACSEPPDGCSRWSLRLLANKMVELEYLDSVSYETVRRTLKKTK